jgi:hypothetical protein
MQLCIIIITTIYCSLFHTQASMINSLQKKTTPMRGQGVKHFSILGNLPVVRDYHYSNSLQQAVWLPHAELHSIS